MCDGNNTKCVIALSQAWDTAQKMKKSLMESIIFVHWEGCVWVGKEMLNI